MLSLFVALALMSTCVSTSQAARQPVDAPLPVFGASMEVDPAFPYYKDRTPTSVATEIKVNGYSVVHYILTADSSFNPQLLDAFHTARVGVWYATFCNGVYTTEDLPTGWQEWKMVMRTDLEHKPLNDGFERLCLNNPSYRAWKRTQIAKMLHDHPFDGIDLMEPHWPEYPGPEGPTYACFCPHCQAAFKKMFPRENSLPNIIDAASPQSPRNNPALWRKWLQFRRATLTDFLTYLVNGPGGIRASAPHAKVCVWTLALSEPNGLKRVQEDSGEDPAMVTRVVKPDLFGLQTHWPDWTKANLPPDYVNSYRPFIASIRSASKTVPIMIQADIGSETQNRHGRAWISAFNKACDGIGATSKTFYEYFIGEYMYDEAPKLVSATWHDNKLHLVFSKRLDPKSAEDANHYLLDRGTVTEAKLDGNLVELEVDRVPPGGPGKVTVREIGDAADLRLFKDKPARVLREQTLAVHR